jgi:hypothetical protein
VHIKCISICSTYEKPSKNKFRKHPHVKIPPKSPSTNFQSLGKFKNPIFNSEIFFLTFGPADLAAHSAFGLASPLASLPPQAETGPPSPRVGRVFTGIHFPFWFAPSELAASPSSLCQAGPGCQLCPPPLATRAIPCHHRFPATERRPALRLGCHRAVTTSPSFSLP